MIIIHHHWKKHLRKWSRWGWATAKFDGHYFCSTLTNTELLPFPKSTVNWGDYIYHIYQYYIYRGFPGGITLLTKVHIIKAMVFPVIVYGCENWTIKKTECWSIDTFELWCRRRLLRVPWTARRSNQLTLKEISPEYSLAKLTLKLEL